MPSIKVLNISLVLLCIFITAFLCTFLAITSSEKALDDTKESRDVSVAAAFSVGEESVTNRTAEYLDVVLSGTSGFVTQFTQQHRQISMGIANELASEPWDKIKLWDFHHIPRYYHAFDGLRALGSSGVTLNLQNRLMISIQESASTVGRGPDEFHNLLAIYNHGNDHPWGGLGRSIRAPTSPALSGYPANVTNPMVDIDWSISSEGCRFAVASNGTIPDLPCNASEWLDPPNHPIVQLGRLIPAKSTLWTPPLPINTFYVATYATATIYHNGTYSGIVTCGVNQRMFSVYLSGLEVGGPVDGHASRGRVYLTLRSTWLPTMTRGGDLIGASHGNVLGRTSQNVPYALLPIESSDSIIRSVANRTADVDLDALVSSRNLTVLNIETDLAPQGEDFYYRVGRIADIYGIDWYVHLVIDREYILGTIDRRTAETRDDIKVAEEKVDDDLKRARTILYGTVVAVAVALTVLSVVFVLKIIEPLLTLEGEMAAVAVMHLEAVDVNRPLSALEEVRLMQVSFLQMIRNLVEYRNYMPASVLQDDEDSEEDGTNSSEQSMKRSHSGSQARSQGSRASQSTRVMAKQQVLTNSEATMKRVTMMVCNMVQFLATKEQAAISGRISKYLAAGLQNLKKFKGIPDSFSGDRLYASWNGVRVCSSHRTAAYMCARELCKVNSSKLSIGLASGSIVCGNMGCDGMKKYSYIGSLSSWVHVVERIGRSMECDVAIDAVVNEEVCNKAYTRMLQHVMFEKHSKKVIVVHEAMKQKEVAEEEWMYQLEEGETNDPNKAYNMSYALFMEGDVAEALEALENFDDKSRVAELYRGRLETALADTKICRAMGSVYPLLF